jgi:soluble lytic murein transglycosylase
MFGSVFSSGVIRALARRVKKKPRYYGRARRRRRRLATALVLAAAALALLVLALRVPDAVREMAYPLRYEETIRQVSAEHGLDPTLVAGVVYVESRFRSDVASPKGAYGLMQILPRTAEFISSRSGISGDYRDPETNLRMGAWYLSYLEERYSGHERLMLAAYNSGEGRVDTWVRQEGFDIERDIPFPETSEYVENVLEARDTYAELYGRNLDRHP